MHAAQLAIDFTAHQSANFPMSAEVCQPVNSAACGTTPHPPVRARRTDAETSHVAAANAEKFAASHAGRILTALRAMGTGTAHEIAVATGLSIVQVDRRRKEMETAKQVYMLRQGGKPFTRDGFMVWAAVEVAAA